MGHHIIRLVYLQASFIDHNHQPSIFGHCSVQTKDLGLLSINAAVELKVMPERGPCKFAEEMNVVGAGPVIEQPVGMALGEVEAGQLKVDVERVVKLFILELVRAQWTGL